jgi:hypothetical protein
MQKKYRVTLTPEERDDLSRLVAVGKAAARTLLPARILLKADQTEGGPAWEDARIADALDVGQRTIGRVRQRFVEQGLAAALGRKQQDRPSRPRKLDGRAEARLTNTSFDLEQAPGNWLGDYEGLAAAGNDFVAVWGMPNGSATNQESIFFRRSISGGSSTAGGAFTVTPTAKDASGNTPPAPSAPSTSPAATPGPSCPPTTRSPTATAAVTPSLSR